LQNQNDTGQGISRALPIYKKGAIMIYSANRENGREVNVTYPNGEVKVLSPLESQGIINHSPDGFNWGYGGSGPAQLALALLLQVTGNRSLSIRLYQDFKWCVIAKFGDAWEMSCTEILEWIGEHSDE